MAARTSSFLFDPGGGPFFRACEAAPVGKVPFCPGFTQVNSFRGVLREEESVGADPQNNLAGTPELHGETVLEISNFQRAGGRSAYRQQYSISNAFVNTTNNTRQTFLGLANSRGATPRGGGER